MVHVLVLLIEGLGEPLVPCASVVLEDRRPWTPLLLSLAVCFARATMQHH